jgi:hypothetical protein
VQCSDNKVHNFVLLLVNRWNSGSNCAGGSPQNEELGEQHDAQIFVQTEDLLENSKQVQVFVELIHT